MWKMIIVTGPRSSGKTSLSHLLLKFEMVNLVTIPPKKFVIENIVTFGEKDHNLIIDDTSVYFNFDKFRCYANDWNAKMVLLYNKITQHITCIELLENKEFLMYSFKDVKIGLEDGINISIIFNEWALWSRCYGKILVINGVSSSGKTTLSKELVKFGFNHVSLDNVCFEVLYNEITIALPSITDLQLLSKQDVLDIVCRRQQFNKNYMQEQLEQIATIKENLELIDQHLQSNLNLSFEKITKQMSEEAKKYIARGENVVVDTVMNSEDIDAFFAFFHFPCKNILLYTSLEQNLENCF